MKVLLSEQCKILLSMKNITTARYALLCISGGDFIMCVNLLIDAIAFIVSHQRNFSLRRRFLRCLQCFLPSLQEHIVHIKWFYSKTHLYASDSTLSISKTIKSKSPSEEFTIPYFLLSSPLTTPSNLLKYLFIAETSYGDSSLN